jgi:hypothetical protein
MCKLKDQNIHRFAFSIQFISRTEQEPTHPDNGSDEEGDLVLLLETEAGLLTNSNQLSKGKNKILSIL